jgi:hypothetical protein
LFALESDENANRETTKVGLPEVLRNRPCAKGVGDIPILPFRADDEPAGDGHVRPTEGTVASIALRHIVA